MNSTQHFQGGGVRPAKHVSTAPSTHAKSKRVLQKLIAHHDNAVFMDGRWTAAYQKLHGAGIAIEASVQVVRSLQGVLNATHRKSVQWEQAYRKEQQLKNDYLHAYHAVFSAHTETIRDLADLASRYRALEKDFESLQTTVLAQDAVVQEYERRMAQRDWVEKRLQVMDAVDQSQAAERQGAITMLEVENLAKE